MKFGRVVIKRDDPEQGQHIYGAVYLPDADFDGVNKWYVGVYHYALAIYRERAS
jgi:hypothetical protein